MVSAYHAEYIPMTELHVKYPQLSLQATQSLLLNKTLLLNLHEIAMITEYFMKWAFRICDPVWQKGLIAGKYMCSLNNMNLMFSIRYYNSVTFIKLSINFHVSGKSFK